MLLRVQIRNGEQDTQTDLHASFTHKHTHTHTQIESKHHNKMKHTRKKKKKENHVSKPLRRTVKPDVIKSGGKKHTDAAAKPAVKTATKSQDLMRNSILLFLERPPGKIQRGKEKQAHAQVPRKNNKSSRERIIDQKARRSTHNQKEKRQARPEGGEKKRS